jgi:hypothetical protein
MQFAMRAFVLLMILPALAGCKLVSALPKGRSPLLPVAASPDAITLEIFSAPAPLGDARLAALWAQVDEQPLPADLRRKLAQNGLRAGLVGPGLPDALADLLKVTDERVATEKRDIVPLETEPGVVLRVMQPRIGKRHEQVVSQSYDQMSLLRCVDGQVEGRTYYKAEGRLVLRVFAEADSRVRLELTPELHHGDFKNRFASSEAMLIMKQERQKQVFEDLKLNATLAPGQMIVITCLPDVPGSIGHFFFTQLDGDKPIQKLYVIRVAQARPDRSFWEGPKEDAGEVSSDMRD